MIADGSIIARPGDEDPGAIALMHKLAEKSRARWPQWAEPVVRLGLPEKKKPAAAEGLARSGRPALHRRVLGEVDHGVGGGEVEDGRPAPEQVGFVARVVRAGAAVGGAARPSRAASIQTRSRSGSSRVDRLPTEHAHVHADLR